MRLGAFFIALCMVLIAGSAGVALYFTFAVSKGEALTAAVGLLGALAIYNIVSTWRRTRAAARNQLAELARGTADMARQAAEMGRRVSALESRAESARPKPRPANNPFAAEVQELGDLVQELAETVAGHESKLAELDRVVAALPSAESFAAEGAPLASPVIAEQAPPPVAAPPVAAAPAINEPPKDEMLPTILAAVAANRVDLYLQPIVTLPQRKVRYYEAMSRLRTERGDVLPAADFIATAERAGLMPQIDNLVIFRCVQVVRRLLAKNREIGLFCNVSAKTLSDVTVFSQLIEFLDANRTIAPSVILEFSQGAFRAAGPIENESLSALAERGFRFSLDNLADLHLEPRALATRGVRFVKVPGSLLLDRGDTTDIHAADLADLLARFGIELIAEKIESEGMVVDLLDFEVRYGQGFLFSPPRPVRAEALQGVAERNDLIVTDSPAPTRAPIKPARSGGLAQLARGRV